MSLRHEWTEEEVADFKLLKSRGLHLIGFGDVISAQTLKEKFQVEEVTDLKLSKVQTAAGGGLFFRISFGLPATGDESDWFDGQVFVSEKMADDLRDFRSKESVYLMAGEFRSLEEAQVFAKKLEEDTEIWKSLDAKKELFRVVLTRTEEKLAKPSKLLALEKKFELRIVPINGASLHRKVAETDEVIPELSSE